MAATIALRKRHHGWPPNLARLLALALLGLALVFLLVTGTLAQIVATVTGRGAAVASYSTTTVNPGNLQVSVAGTGPIAANVNVPLSFKSSGKLTAIAVKVGDKVAQGQLLATLDTPDLQVALEQAQAARRVAEQNLVKAQAGATDAAIAAAQTGVDNARRTAAAAQDALGLVEVATSRDLAAAQASINSAQVSLDAASATLAAAQEQEAKGLTVGQATVASSERNLATAKDQAARSLAVDQLAITNAQRNLDAARDQEAKQLAAGQLAVANAQKSLDATKATLAAQLEIIEQQITQSSFNLWAALRNRDAICENNQGTQCDVAMATASAAQASVTIAESQLAYSRKQGEQQVGAAQATLDSAKAQLERDQASLRAAVVSAQNAVELAQAQFEQDQVTLRAAVASAEHALTAAQAQLEKETVSLRAAVVTAENQVRQAAAAQTAAQAAFDQADAKAAQALQAAHAQLTTARNAVQTAETNYNQIVAPPSPADAEIARAQLASAQAAVDAAQRNLDDARLVAPFAGTIAAINGSIGQWVTGGAPSITSTGGGSTASPTAIMTLFNLDSLQVTVQVNEADIAKVEVGDLVTFRVSAYPDKSFSGRVLSIQPAGTTTSNVVSYDVASSIDPLGGATLYPGMTATASIITAERHDVLLIPNTALSFAQAAIQQGRVAAPEATGPSGAAPAADEAAPMGTSVAGPTEGTVVTLIGTTPVAKRVTLGLAGTSQTEVVAGLTAGETVVVGEAVVGSSGSGSRSPGMPPPGGLFGP